MARLVKFRTQSSEPQVPSIFSQPLPTGASDVERIRRAVALSSQRRRPDLGDKNCVLKALAELPEEATPAEIEAFMIDPAGGWKPHHSLDAIMDQFYFYRSRAERIRSRTLHINNIIRGEFAATRGRLEEFLTARAGDLDLANLRTLANWMNAEGNHPNPRGWFSQPHVLERLPKAFVIEDLPTLRSR